MTVKTKDIEIKYNPRTQFEGIDELANSIKELGILQPLAVAKGADGKYVITHISSMNIGMFGKKLLREIKF